MIKNVDELSLEGRRVFIRVDFNTPLRAEGEKLVVADDSRIRAALPTIQHCLKAGARVILASHLGRPKGQVVAKYSLEPVAARLAEMLETEVLLSDEPVGDGAKKLVGDMREGQVILLENLRFHPGETKNEEQFARSLASYADVYVNDAFGTAHRAHASTAGMVEFVSEAAAGFLMKKEIDALGRLLGDVDRPYLAILGGAKVSDKIQVLEALLKRVNAIVIGGAMANTFLKAQGLDVGKSLVEEDKLPVARSFLRKAGDRGVDVLLPTDAVVADDIKAASGQATPIGELPTDQAIFDIGPETARRYAERITKARTLFWNGPMGVFEHPPFAEGTLAVARAVADNSPAFTVVGGGDSVAAIGQAGVDDKIDHVSTGGGASLEFIQGLTLPGIAALESAGGSSD